MTFLAIFAENHEEGKNLIIYIFIDFFFMNKGGNWSHFRFIIGEKKTSHTCFCLQCHTNMSRLIVKNLPKKVIINDVLKKMCL